MELRHLRYFVAVAETGSLTVAAEKRLHTSQPSLSRQIRDLEDEVGAELFSRSARGVELTAAGKAFLDHARLALTQVDAATEAARRGLVHVPDCTDERTLREEGVGVEENEVSSLGLRQRGVVGETEA